MFTFWTEFITFKTYQNVPSAANVIGLKLQNNSDMFERQSLLSEALFTRLIYLQFFNFSFNYRYSWLIVMFKIKIRQICKINSLHLSFCFPVFYFNLQTTS